MPRYEVAIVGAGALGAACAWHLARAGTSDVLVLDRGQPCSGTSPRGAGLVNRLLWHPEDIGLVDRSIDQFIELDATSGASFAYNASGGLLIVGPEDEHRAQRLLRVWRAQGIDVSKAAPADVEALPGCEHLRIQPDETCYLTQRDGWCVTTDAVNAMLSQARDQGVQVRAHARVSSVDDDGVHLTGGDTLQADRTIVAAGVWTPQILPSGWQAPIQPYRAQACVLEHGGSVQGPCVHDVPNKTYWRSEGPGRVLAGNGTDLSNQDLTSPPRADTGFAPSIVDRLARRWDAMREAALVRAWAGYEAGTPDARPLVGPVPGLESVLLCAGGNGFGFMRSPALGEAAATLAREDPPPEPVEDLRPDRFPGTGGTFEMREGFSLG